MSVEDASRKSWVESANGVTDFPIQNLPFGVFSTDGEPESGRVGIAIGDQILDVRAALHEDLIGEEGRIAAHGCDSPRLNELMSLDRKTVSGLRRSVADLLDASTDVGRRAHKHASKILVAQRSAVMHLPAEVGDYTDFYASIDHATNVGSIRRARGARANQPSELKLIRVGARVQWRPTARELCSEPWQLSAEILTEDLLCALCAFCVLRLSVLTKFLSCGLCGSPALLSRRNHGTSVLIFIFARFAETLGRVAIHAQICRPVVRGPSGFYLQMAHEFSGVGQLFPNSR